MSARTRSAFSLLELAVVLTILSVVVVFGLDIGRDAMRGADRLQTQEKLSVIQRALDQFAAQNGYLPCPALRSATPSTTVAPVFGVESRTGTTGCTVTGDITSSGGVLVGMVPVRTLSLPDTYASDAWGNKILYGVSSAHTNSVSAYAGTTGSIIMKSGTVSGTNYNITAQLSDAAGALTEGAGAIYVVVSHGPDGKGAYPLFSASAAVACGSTATLTDNENCNGDATFYDSDYNEGSQAASFFDDYVVWGSNQLQRYPSGSNPGYPASCASGCDPWCAPCSLDTGANGSPRKLCEKFITSTSPCRATCIWGGQTSGGQFDPCP